VTARIRRAFVVAALVAASAAHDVARAGDAPRAIDAIENDLVADDPSVRAKAALELVDRFPDGAVAVPILVDLLDDESPDVVAAAARAIDSMAVAGAGVFAKTFVSSPDANPNVPLADAYRWNVVSPRVPAGKDTASKLASLGGASLYSRLRDLDEPRLLMRLVATARAEQGDLSLVAAAALALEAADRLADRRTAPSFHPLRGTAAATWLDLLNSDDPIKAWAAARMLGRLRATNDVATARLASFCSAHTNSDSLAHHLAVQALLTLSAIGTGAESAAPCLISLLETEDFQPLLVYTLVALGHESDVLTVLKRKASNALAIASELAYERRGGQVAIPLLIEQARRDPSHHVTDLAEYGAAAAEALPTLREAFEKAKTSDSVTDDIELAETILSIHPADASAVGYLDAVLTSRLPRDARFGVQWHSSDAWRQNWACVALISRGCVTPAATAYATARLKLSDDALATEETRDLIDAMQRGDTAIHFVAELVALGTAENEERARNPPKPPRRFDFWTRIARALATAGTNAAPAIPLLTEWKSNGDETIRVAAAQALRRIRAKTK